MTNHFKKNFNYIRKRFDVTQGWLALQVDKSQQTIGGWGTGASEPNIEKLIKISEIFGISVDYLLTVDLEKGNLITDAHVEEFKQKGNVNSKLIGKLKAPYKGFEEYNSIVNEPDPVKEWAVISILKQMDVKLDLLLNRGENKKEK